MPETFDLFVIGGGSGGVRAARIAAGLGAKVGLAEVSRMGGTCVNLGCVPKKLYHYASDYAHHFGDAAGFGWSPSTSTHDWAQMTRAVREEVQRLNGIYEGMLKRAGVHVFNARARFLSPHSLQVGDEVVEAKHILIATGGVPWLPDEPWTKDAAVSDAVFDLAERPKRVAVVGAGYIGVEFATIFRALGSEVHLIHHSPKPLRALDEDIRDHFTAELEAAGLVLHFNASISSTQRDGAGELHISLDTGDSVDVDFLLAATGRTPNTKGLGLDVAGVELLDDGRVSVDKDFASSQKHIFAVGDVCSKLALTPIALAGGMYVARRLYDPTGSHTAPDLHKVPTAVFSHPQIATVGLTEEEARQEHEVDVYESEFRAMRHTLGGRNTRTYMKLVVDRKTDQVLGCHMMGEEAGEIVQGLGVALQAGATKADFDRTIGIHPTAAEEFVTMRAKRADS